MPGAYPRYPNTPAGDRDRDFWMNLRFGTLAGCAAGAVIMAALLKPSKTLGIIAGCCVFALFFGMAFLRNWGGKLARFVEQDL